MSDLESATFSEVAANNNAASPNGAPEGMAPSGVNDTIREVMAAVKREWNRSHATVSSTGSANAYVITYTTAPATLVNGQQNVFVANFANTGSATANINSLGAKTIKKQTSSGMANLASGDIQSGQHVHLEYELANDIYVLLNPQAGSNFAGGTLTALTSMSGAALNEADAGNLASASTVNIGAAAGNSINITGTTTITAFDSVQAGTVRLLRFAGALTLTHNATSLILPNNGSNITTAASDVAIMQSLGSGNWKCLVYQKANGQALVGATGQTYSNFVLLIAGTTWNVPAGVSEVLAILQGAGGGGGGTGSTGSTAAGGGAPGATVTALVAVTPGGTVTYSIGAKGTGASAGNNPGNNGGNTTFGSITAKGGNGGGGSNNGTPGTAGAAPGFSPVFPTGGTAPILAISNPGNAAANSSNSGAGGVTQFGSGGASRSSPGTGNAASTANSGAGGGGGAGSAFSNTGGNGADGCVVIFY